MHSESSAYVYQHGARCWRIVVPIRGKLAPRTVERDFVARDAAQTWLDGPEGRRTVADMHVGPLQHVRARTVDGCGRRASFLPHYNMGVNVDSASPQGASRGTPRTGIATLMQALALHAELQPEKIALRFLGVDGVEEETVSYAGLRAKVEALSQKYQAQGLTGSRIVLARQTSIEAVATFFAVLAVGATAVPIDPRLLQRPSLAIDGILKACAPAILSIDPGARPSAAVVAGATFIDDVLQRAAAHANSASWTDSTAVLQFTSGSTSLPKGVRITHANLLANVEAISQSLRLTADDVTVSWLPLFHDMGLMLGVVWPLVTGATAVLMRPTTFIAKPATWLHAISRYRVTVSSAPNFGYQHCVDRVHDDLKDIDLSSWRIAISGAEPVRPATVLDFSRRFAPCGFEPSALVPCYGLAEATVFVSGVARDEPPAIREFDEAGLSGPTPTARPSSGDTAVRRLVSCGRPAGNLRVRIVGPDRRTASDGTVGEIWVAGPSVSPGYLDAPAATAAAFAAELADDGACYLRTGDLGFMLDGELFVSGRLKDLIIVRGANHHPNDIEATCRASSSVLSSCECAAFAVDDDGVTVIVEIPRDSLPQAASLATAIRREVGASHGLALREVAFVAPRRLPRTTSGKIKRGETASLLRVGRLPLLLSFEERDGEGKAPDLGPKSASTETLVREAWAVALGDVAFSSDENFFEVGGDSIRIAMVHAWLAEKTGRGLKLSDLFANPTVRSLAAFIEADGGSSELNDARARGRSRAAGGDRRIAIVGMACRFPGAPDVETFWDAISSGRETIATAAAAKTVPGSRLISDIDAVRPARLAGADLFDASFFGIAFSEAEMMDPQQRVLLECAHEALEAAGCDPGRLRGSVGTFVGSGMNASRLALLDRGLINRTAADRWATILGNDKDYLAALLAFKLGLSGPSLTVQTACSTSLVAVHLACQALVSRECGVALAGGVAIGNGAVVPGPSIGDVFSREGQCRPFDKAADGTVFSDGCGIVVLKRLSDALADGDHVHAVIRGSAMNSDGPARVGFTAPGTSGQAAVVAEALAVASVSAADIGHVEAHGTGTAMGDPVEVAALTRAFRMDTDAAGYCSLGAVKANIGHTTAAAGVAGLIKTVLMLERSIVPPQINFSEPNGALDLPTTPFHINAVQRPWTRGHRARLVGVSSFGMGGINAHVVLEEAPPTAASPRVERPELVLVSAKTAAALDEAVAHLKARLSSSPDTSIADVAFSLAIGRRELPHRCATIAGSISEACEGLTRRNRNTVRTARAGAALPVVFAVPGSGSQRVLMGRAIYKREAAYRDTFDRCCSLLSAELGFDLRAAVLESCDNEEASRRLAQVEVAQPAQFAVSMALADLWSSWGITPAALIGHSFGEIPAACIAGVFNLEDAAKFVALRSQLVAATEPGAMLAILARREEFEDALAPSTTIACMNGEAAYVVSGPRDDIVALDALLVERGVLCRPLATDRAFHSSAMDPTIEALVSFLRGTRLRAPRIPLISNVTGGWMGPAQATSPEYWGRHLREPVRFADGLAALAASDARVFLEVGPGRALSKLMQQAFFDRDPLIASSLPVADGGSAEEVGLLKAAGELWTAGCHLDVRRVAPAEGRKVQLPGHPLQRRSFKLAVDADDAAIVEHSSGKERDALEQEPQRPLPWSIDPDIEPVSVYVPLASSPGLAIAEVWSSILGAPVVTADDDFSELGGHSLLAARVADKLTSRFGHPVTAADVLRFPTPRRMAQHLVSAGADLTTVLARKRSAPETAE